ncbi:SprT family zinc-dependent metalloprotease [Sulfuricaulis sp.]
MSLNRDLFSTEVDGGDDSPTSLDLRLHTAVEACYRRAEMHFRRCFERPRLSYQLRGLAAAAAYPAQNAIRINRLLLEQNTDDYLQNTVPHEVSHLVAYRLHGRRIAPHGAEWAAIMREVYGLEPRRCHDYDVRLNMKVVYRYGCGCDAEHALGVRRHKSAERGRRYYCRRCRQALRFLPGEDSVLRHVPAPG